MIFIQFLMKENWLEQKLKKLIIILVAFGWLSVCRGIDPAKITKGVGKWSQDRDSVTLFYKTDNKDPELFLALTTSTELHLRIGNTKEILRLEGGVEWPLQWLIDHKLGAVKIKLKKKVRQNWAELTADTSQPIINKLFWGGLIRESKHITGESYLVRLQTVDQVFQHVPVAHYVALRKQELAPYDETEYYTVVPAVEEEMKETSEIWRSSNEMINLIIKRIEGSFVGPYAAIPVLPGMSYPIYVSSSGGSFLTSYLNKKEVFLFAAGTGLTPMICIIVWVLKYQPETTIKFYYFNKEPKFVIWKDKLERLSVENTRFTIENVYTDENWIRQNNWTGLQGHVTRKMLENALPKGNKQDRLVCICGMDEFTYFIEDFLSGVLGYEINKNYFPFRQPREKIAKTEQEFKILHPQF